MYLAHGALGPLDEILQIGIAFVFIGVIGYSWWKNRDTNLEPDIAEEIDGKQQNTGDVFVEP